MLRFGISALTLTAVLACHTASAHYLWVVVDAKSGEHGTTNVYFEGGPSPGDGQYLDPFVSDGKTTIRTVKNSKPVALDMKVVKQPGKRWLSAELPAASPRSIDSYGKWGVYRYGETDVLLHYNARSLEADSPEALKTLAAGEGLTLDIVPRLSGENVEAQVLLHGKPAAGRSVSVRGGGLKESLKTDEKGFITFTPDKPGLYTLKTTAEEKKSGTDGGKEYTLVRHHSNIRLTLPIGK